MLSTRSPGLQQCVHPRGAGLPVSSRRTRRRKLSPEGEASLSAPMTAKNRHEEELRPADRTCLVLPLILRSWCAILLLQRCAIVSRVKSFCQRPRPPEDTEFGIFMQQRMHFNKKSSEPRARMLSTHRFNTFSKPCTFPTSQTRFSRNECATPLRLTSCFAFRHLRSLRAPWPSRREQDSEESGGEEILPQDGCWRQRPLPAPLAPSLAGGSLNEKQLISSYVT